MKQKTKITGREWLLILLCGVCIAAAIGMLVFFPAYVRDRAYSETAYDEKLIVFNDSWLAAEADFEETVSLPHIFRRGKSASVSVTKKLPESLMEGTYIRFRSDNVIADVYIDSQLIYSSEGFQTVYGGIIASEKWNFVPLKPEYSGRPITVTFTSPYSYYQGAVPEMVLGTLSEVMLYTVSSSGLSIYLSICIIAMGLIMLFLSVVNTLTDASLRSYTYLGLYIIFLGLLTLTRAQYPRSYENAYYSDYLLFHLTLRICPILHFLYIYAKSKEKYRKLFGLCAAFGALQFITGCALNFAGSTDFTQSLWAAVIFFTVPNLLVLYTEVLKRGSGSRRYRQVMGFGEGVYLTGIFSEIVFRISQYTNGQKTVLIGCSLIFAACQCIAVIISSYDLASEQIAVSKELEEKRIKLMMSQMQPHFIYNTLNTIREMTLADPQRAYEMIYHFSSYLKHNIAALSDSDIIPFAKELEHIKAYTAIECERFGDKISVEYDIQTVNFLVPPLTIEPFVENAIKHGIRRRAAKGSVTVSTEIMDHHFLIKIIDDGAGFDPSSLNADDAASGIGIKNATFRLRELMGAHVEIKSAVGSGCSVMIIIPKILSEGDMQ